MEDDDFLSIICMIIVLAIFVVGLSTAVTFIHRWFT